MIIGNKAISFCKATTFISWLNMYHEIQFNVLKMLNTYDLINKVLFLAQSG